MVLSRLRGSPPKSGANNERAPEGLDFKTIFEFSFLEGRNPAFKDLAYMLADALRSQWAAYQWCLIRAL